MNNRPIGVFDSGLGGLTAVKELKKMLPNEDIVYFGDTGRVPYGTRSRETIIKYAFQDIKFLLRHQAKLIIAACGTVSSVANEEIKERFNLPYTGVVSPTAFAACKATRNKKVGVLGTAATINSHSYKKQIEVFDCEIEVIEQPCPLFVPFVENGIVSKDETLVRLIVERYLAQLKSFGVDTVVLGCTHYPLLKDAIADFLGSSVTLIDSGKETAVYAAKLLKEKDLLSSKQQPGEQMFFVSDTPEGFTTMAGLFLGESMEKYVRQINVDVLYGYNAVKTD
ncbi:MAG: glutamate racemase [Oscillospiraceae bacterium]|jgi:glutamate racemase|nr:glutamate racemase [Oscillospiraceae bacterium]